MKRCWSLITPYMACPILSSIKTWNFLCWSRNSIGVGALFALCLCCVPQHLQYLTNVGAPSIFLNEWMECLPRGAAALKHHSIPWVSLGKVMSSLGLRIQIQEAIRKCVHSVACRHSAFHLSPTTDFPVMILCLKCAGGCTHPYLGDIRNNSGHNDLYSLSRAVSGNDAT